MQPAFQRVFVKVANTQGTTSQRFHQPRKAVAEALTFLREIEGKTRPNMSNAPLDVATKGWKRVLMDDGKIDRRAYTLCVLERLQDSLRRRDIYVTPSERWNDPRAKLLRLFHLLCFGAENSDRRVQNVVTDSTVRSHFVAPRTASCSLSWRAQSSRAGQQADRCK